MYLYLNTFEYKVHLFHCHTNCYTALYFDREQVAAFLPFIRRRFRYSWCPRETRTSSYTYLLCSSLILATETHRGETLKQTTGTLNKLHAKLMLWNWICAQFDCIRFYLKELNFSLAYWIEAFVLFWSSPIGSAWGRRKVIFVI